jgi:hypothetical protein
MLGVISKLFGGPAPPANYYPAPGAMPPPGGPPSSSATNGMRPFPKGDPRNCIDNSDLHIMQVPGNCTALSATHIVQDVFQLNLRGFLGPRLRKCVRRNLV